MDQKINNMLSNLSSLVLKINLKLEEKYYSAFTFANEN
jgi:hypothetical protein